MEFLFSQAGSQQLQQFIQPDTLCMFDFDGTLAPIVERYDEAALPPDISAPLQQLSRYAPVGIITGRGVADVRARLSFAPQFVIGNHGLEGVPGWKVPIAEYIALCQTWVSTLRAALSDHSQFSPQILLEEKQFSVSVHYRIDGDRDEAACRLRRLFDTLTPRPRIIGGKCVFNLMPQDALNKGSALVELLRVTGAHSAIYIGDDDTDEDVFRLQRKDIFSVRVGRNDSTAADYFLNDRAEMSQVLRVLIDRFEQYKHVDAN